jgi:amino acid transporter
MSDDEKRKEPAVPSAGPGDAADDESTLHAFGYAQELLRRMSGFSNFAISLSIICILAGGVTSFQVGYGSVGGASIGLGWPLSCLFSLIVAATMAQIASAFPTAGGLYHWASILGGRGFGWITAWFNLLGLVTVLAAINVGTYLFVVGSLGKLWGLDPAALGPGRAAALQAGCVVAITGSQALVNHLGIGITSKLTDFSGYWILGIAALLTVALLFFAPHLDAARLWTFVNNSGAKGGKIWPETTSLGWLFLLGFLLPAYTVTGFDASAHTSEETVSASVNVPRGIVRSVLVSGLFGWAMLSAVVLAAPDPAAAAATGDSAFTFIVGSVLPRGLSIILFAGIALAQYLCGLATVTSASRMAYAFARDGGLPFSKHLRRVSPRFRTPAAAVWSTAVLSVAFTLYARVYSTIAAVCVIFLYLSYALPTALGFAAHGRTWTTMGPFTLGRWYRPLAAISVIGCLALVVIGVQPPNDLALWIVLGCFGVAAAIWFGVERKRFVGPPVVGARPSPPER